MYDQFKQDPLKKVAIKALSLKISVQQATQHPNNASLQSSAPKLQ